MGSDVIRRLDTPVYVDEILIGTTGNCFRFMMDTEPFLDYTSSLTMLGNGEVDFETEWTTEDLEQRDHCPPIGIPVANDRIDSEDNRTVITESMSVTASDEEKVQLLNKNTELRRLNAELMKLNQQWDEIYRNTTHKMQQTVRILQDEVQSLRKHSDKLSLMLEHEQNKREFYETSLLQEMKRNQKLQEYVRHLEKSMHYNTLSQRGVPNDVEIPRSQSRTDAVSSPIPASRQCPDNFQESQSNPEKQENHTGKVKKQAPDHQTHCKTSKSQQFSRSRSLYNAESVQDVNQLKEQLQALKCQTEIYAADYKTEHTDRERMKTENEKLRRKEREMREQMLILQEQLKIYEDDFQKERSDKQVLQRLLKSRHSAREPVLVHRCNNEPHLKGPLGNGGSTSQSSTRREEKARDGVAQPPPYCIGY
uniref:Uncharacterized protein n=2 Tax=Leptobrachium leishanense TaxID=445787 RepID=A0A8C5MW38_9ANUR